ncbi:DUF1302 family protein [Zavarzinia sp.]|uniref:DUF1302 domain-containing protein n=1 Tax=Zavarzinia sp. TaxID=2027920 RepID=UPI0035649C70
MEGIDKAGPPRAGERRTLGRRYWLATTALCLLGVATTASAYDFELGEEVTGSITVSLTTGAQMRMADRDPRNYGYYYGGALPPAGNDDGNFNFDKYDLISQVSNARAELKLKWQNFVFYARGAGFFDSVAANNHLADFDPEERPFTSGRYTPSAKKKAAWGAKLLDFYVRGSFDVGDRPLTVTLGNQILNWGEALFTINGIAVVNPIDVARIRVPGAELKDALIPVPMISANYEIADGLSVEAFYQFDFEPFKLDACGSFFSFTDNLCDGVKYAQPFTDPFDPRAYTTQSGLRPGDYDDPNRQILSVNPPLNLKDDPDVHDWGVSLRYFSPELNNTEFQLYYINYTSRLPSLMAHAPAQFAPGTGQVNLGALPVPLVDGLLNNLGVDQLGALTSALSGLLGGPVTDIVGALTNPLSSALIQPPFGTSPRSTVLQNLENSPVDIYYPTGLQLIGFAFNTTFDPLAVAINAEISWKHDAPIWISEPAFLASYYNMNGGVPVSQATTAPTPICVGSLCVPNPGIAPQLEPSFRKGQDTYEPNRTLTLDERHNVWQAAVRFMKIMGGSDFVTRLLGANQLFGLVEFGALYIDLDPNTQYAAYGQNSFEGFFTRPLNIGPVGLAGPIDATSLGAPFGSSHKLPSQWSGGVQGIFFWDYPNILDGVTMTPSIGFAHGLFGTTPAPNPGFVKSLTSVNFGLRFDYLDHWSMNINYFKSWGAGNGGSNGASRNPYLDRDFVGVSVSYSF